jgi:peroxiredoxin
VRVFSLGLLTAGLLACSAPSSSSSGSTTPAGGTTPAGELDDGGPSNGTSESAPSGPKAPDFTLPTLDGGQVRLSDLKGKKVVLLDFWSTTCDPCLREMPELVKIYNDKKAAGFEVLAISVDGPDTASDIPAKMKSTGMNFPVLLDEETEVMDRYNPKGEMPFTVLVDRDGRIVLKRAGYQPGDTASMQELIDAIDSALARK